MEYQDKSIKELQELVVQFVNERDWKQFQTPKNMSMYLSLEAAELMEIFVWCESSLSEKTLEENRDKVQYELVDIMYWILNFAARYDINLSHVFEEKMKLNALKYPIDKAKSNSKKYTEL